MKGRPPLRAHDVRRLRMCCYCSRPGLVEDLLELANGLAHVECFVGVYGAPALLKLPAADRAKVRLGQVGSEIMGALLEIASEP